MGVSYVEKQFTADAEHVALTKPIIPENLDRKAFLIVGVSSGAGMVQIGIKSNGVGFISPRSADGRYIQFTRDTCPVNALYLTGLSVGSVVTIWEASN